MPWIQTPSRPRSKAGVILLIDPDPRSAAALEDALESAGHQVVAAPNASAALNRASNDPISAVVLDVSGEGESLDFSTLDRLAREPATTTAAKVIVSSHADTANRIEALRRGADDVMAKPCDGEELALRLERRLLSAPQRQSTAGLALRRALAVGQLEAPLTIGRYRVEEVIGQGGVGIVLRGTDPRLNRPVAVKLLSSPEVTGSGWSDLSEIQQEATALARFDHPHIVKIFDAGRTHGLPFLVMELVEGESLDRRLEAGPLEPAKAVVMAKAVADALVEAHGHGWVHRDIKPANILLGRDGTIKVTDFGLAGMVTEAERGESIRGTPGYAPPECLVGEPHTELGDLFALGAVLYRALTGQAAFTGGSVRERLATTLYGRRPKLEESVPGLPRPLYQLVDSLLQALPSARPASAKLVARRLEWLVEAVAYKPLPNESLEPAETRPVTRDLIN